MLLIGMIESLVRLGRRLEGLIRPVGESQRRGLRGRSHLRHRLMKNLTVWILSRWLGRRNRVVGREERGLCLLLRRLIVKGLKQQLRVWDFRRSMIGSELHG